MLKAFPLISSAHQIKGVLSFSARLFLLLGFLAPCLQADDLLPAQQSVVRDGLPNVARKLAAADPIKIVFLGGSITYGGGEHGYVHQVTQWFKDNYPDATIESVNAGVSGTDSNFGAKRLDRDVLVHKPDLLLVEFAVNDGDRDHTEHMERIIHKTWMQNQQTDIVIFYTLAKNHLPHYDNGVLPPSAQAHERVAAHYGIPTIGPAHDVAAKLKAGKLEWETFSNDNCHPKADGYALFAETFRAALPALLASPGTLNHDFSQPITPDLVVYPKPVETKPLDVPDFVNADGKTADTSFVLPKVGINWAGEPTFANDAGKTIWRMHFLQDRRNQPLDASLATKRTDYSGNLASWFEEARAFAGSSSFLILEPGNRRLLYSDKEAAVVAFVAPETGSYAFRATSTGYSIKETDKWQLAFNVVEYAWGGPTGESVAFALATGSQPFPEKVEGTVDLVAGEELIFAITSDAPGWHRNGLKDFDIAIGLYK